jgi:hypothetical protein
MVQLNLSAAEQDLDQDAYLATHVLAVAAQIAPFAICFPLILVQKFAVEENLSFEHLKSYSERNIWSFHG